MKNIYTSSETAQALFIFIFTTLFIFDLASYQLNM